jgi:solute carrier family 25 S-adenosylmethionine transporter 26
MTDASDGGASSSSSSSSFRVRSSASASASNSGGKTATLATSETPAMNAANVNRDGRSKTIPAKTLLGLTVSGVCAGVFVETLFYPLDTIKTRLQAARGGTGLLGANSNKANLFKGVFNGLSKNIAGCAPATALFFLAYEPTKRYLERTLPPEQNYVAMFTAGATGCLASSVVRVPTEVIKTRAQTGNRVQSLGGILRASGIAGLFVGYGSFLIRDLPFDAIEFSLYEEAKIAYAKWRGRTPGEVTRAEATVLGATAGGITGFVTTPLDVIKTRLMTDTCTINPLRGVVDCGTRIVREEGAKALFRGASPRVAWISLGGGAFFGVLESARKVFVPENW